MVYFLIVWALLIVTCFPIGLTWLNILQANCFDRLGDRFIASIGLGLVTICVVLLATSLVLPLAPWVGATVAILMVLLSGIVAKTRRDVIQFLSDLSPYSILGCLGLAIMAAAFTSQKIVWFDTGLYHFGIIRWLSQFGAVPGVALINAKFGFTSSWFALAAPLVPDFLGSQVGAVTNGFIFFIAAVQTCMTLTRIWKGNSHFPDWFLSIASGVALVVYLLTAVTGAPILISFSADIAITFLTIITAWSILIISKDRDKNSLIFNHYLDPAVIPLVLSVGAVSIKLSALPLLVIGFLYFIFTPSSFTGISKETVKHPRIVWAVLIVIIGLLPMVAFAITTSGCPLYPSTAMCLDVPWSITDNQRIVTNEVNEIRFWWKLNSSDASLDPTSFLTPIAPFLNWFSGSSESQAMILATIISIFGIPWSLLRANRDQIPGRYWLIGLGLLGITLIMTQSPLLRFGLGYFVLVPALISAKVIRDIWARFFNRSPHKVNPNTDEKLLKPLTFISLFLAGLTLVAMLSSESRHRLFLPPELPRTKLLTEQVNDVQYSRPANRALKCWAAELPCASVPVHQNVRLRDPNQGIGGGFVHRD
ncbi:MAG: LIC_10190 family membrane protein [Microcoleaceae cyanobacterium]